MKILVDASHGEFCACDFVDLFSDELADWNVDVSVACFQEDAWVDCDNVIYLGKVLSWEVLRDFRVLVVLGACRIFHPAEVRNLVRFVRGGRGLVVASDAGGDFRLGGNLSELVEWFGFRFLPIELFDYRNFLGNPCNIVVRRFGRHYVTERLDRLYFRGCCPVEFFGKPSERVLPLAFVEGGCLGWDYSSGVRVRCSGLPIAFLREVRGRVAVLGDYDIFLWRQHDWMQRRFCLRLLNWVGGFGVDV